MVVHKKLCSFLVVVCMLGQFTAKETSTHIRERILSSIHRLCPFAKICDADTKWQYDRLSKDAVPCCTGCSCANNCNVNGTCCFLSRVGSRANTSSKEDTRSEYHSSCLFPGSRKPSFGKNYFMIDTCPFGCRHNSQPESLDKCGDVRVAWGSSLLPVYSPSTRKLYKNTACSSCHDVKDGIIWDISRFCLYDEKIRHTRIDMSEFINIDPVQNYTKNCELTFLYPRHWADIEHLVCRENPIVGKCFKENFEVPANTNMTSSEVKAACESSFHSPVYSKTLQAVFANIYCSICSAGYTPLVTVCSNPNVVARNMREFTYLLKGQDIQTTYINKQENVGGGPIACPDETINIAEIKDCRVVHCRTGQIRSPTGECREITTYWQANYDVVVDLTPLSDIPIAYLEAVKNDTTLGWLRKPFPSSWKLVVLVYKTKTKNGRVCLEKMIASLRIKTVVSLNSVILTVGELLKKQWHLHLNGLTFTLVQELSPIYEFYKNSRNVFCAYTSYAKEINKQNEERCLYNVIFMPFTENFRSSFVMTKLVFCEQVELREQEYNVTIPKRIIFYQRQQRTMFEGEFVYVFNPDTGNDSVRVCLADAGFKVLNLSTRSQLSECLTVLSLIFVFLN